MGGLDDNNGGHSGGHGADHGISTPVEVDNSDVGAGVEYGALVTAGICVLLIILGIFAL